jgi:hypothetical protein
VSFTNRAVTSFARLAGQVKRYHTWPVHREQSVGEHTWQLMRIWLQIFGELLPIETKQLLWHDAGELVTGDPPFPIKAQNPSLKELYEVLDRDALVRMSAGPQIPKTVQTKVRAKVCDLVEMYEFGVIELLMGNRLAQPIIKDTHDAVLRLAAELSLEDRKRVLAYIDNVDDWAKT